MNFSDVNFLFVFLPIALLVFHLVLKMRAHNASPVVCILLISIIFYSVSSFFYLVIFSISLVLNYLAASAQVALPKGKKDGKLALLVIIVLANLTPLLYFKFLLLDMNPLTISRQSDTLTNILLPLGISFYTFQQIAFQIDSYWGRISNVYAIHYFSFVSFFPQLIAGPVVFQKDLMPQFYSLGSGNNKSHFILPGLALFSIGLFKKGIISERFATIVDHAYSELTIVGNLSSVDAWAAVYAFPLQVYFDFSAYSDMACGLALLFGIRLCQNFNSPFKATSIIDFWTMWHISLMNFFRNYVYNPIAVKLFRSIRRDILDTAFGYFLTSFIPVMIIFLMTGLWHGASLNFLFYGLVHGLAVFTNQFWRHYINISIPGPVGWFLTFNFVCFALLLMRCEDISQFNLYIEQLNFRGGAEQWLGSVYLGSRTFIEGTVSGLQFLIMDLESILLVIFGVLFCILLPNSNQLVRGAVIEDADGAILKLTEKHSAIKLIFLGMITGISVMGLTNKTANFIYFQF